MRVLAAAGLACSLAAMSAAQPLDPKDAPKKDPTESRQDGPAQGPLASEQSLDKYQSRPVREVKTVGLVRTSPDLANNQIRVRAGTPLDAELVRADVQRLNRLGQFREINAKVLPLDDGSVTLVYEVVETPVVVDVEVSGNRQISNAELSGVVNILKDNPVDEYQIGAAMANIQRLYRDKGYYLATVTYDKDELEKRSILLFRINEGDRVKVTDIRFEGNKAFKASELFPSIKTTTAGLFETGPVDNDVLDSDVAQLVEFYKDRGYLDIRCDRQLTFAPNGKEAIVTFVMDEGRVYTLRSVKTSLMDGAGQPLPNRPEPVIFSRDQIAGLLEIKAGDVYSADKIRRSIDVLQNAYAREGFADARVTKAELRDETRPEVDLLILLREGERSRVGRVDIKGNELTRKEVILRELDTLQPNRPLDTSTKRVGDRRVLEAEDRLNTTRLFEPGSVRLTVQPEDPKNPGYRDVLLELKETNTGSLGFGAGISSDSGVIGNIRLNQRNFDVTDVPDSFSEFIAGRAFRGGGQDFNIELAPGSRVQTYTLSLSDPYVFNTDYSAGGSVFYRTREFDEYDENRYGGTFSVGRRFGERWAGNINFRYNSIDISDIDADAAQDFFDVEGLNELTGLGFKLTRTTVDSRFRPSKGTRVELGLERVGALGGDFEFTKLSGEHQIFFTVDEDFLGRRTILSLKTTASYIPEGEGETPVFERFFLGGRSFRGFRFRTISPKGLRGDGSLTNDPVGGTWSFTFSPEIEKPLWRDMIAGVAFVDTGTVTNDIGFDKMRLSVGVGLRLYIEALGPVPLAFDFGFPLVKHFGDEERVFSFSVDLPF